MNFIPNSNIKLLSNVPLDNTYKDTLTFSDAVAQSIYFSSKSKYSSSDYTYQRIEQSIRFQQNTELLFDCNYLMFQNTNFGNKWFYAFITKINYINPETTEISFELDVMQTWYFDYQVKPCFVEREHVNNDAIGAHTLPEGLETGSYVTTSSSEYLVDGLNIYIMATESLEKPYWNEPSIVGGFPVPCYWASLGTLDDFAITILKLILDDYATAGKVDAIVAVFTAPHNMVSTTSSIREELLACPPAVLTYTSKNNKLYTYPYTCMAFMALGQAVELKYELFNESPAIKIRGGFGANMQVLATPTWYEGQAENIQNSITLKDFPVCAWVTNYFQNWLAQNKATLAINTINAATSIVAGGAAMYLTGGAIGGGQVAGGIAQVANSLNAVYQNSIIPDKMAGTANAGDIAAVSLLSGFQVLCRTIRPEYAKVIDDFFSMFGYKVNTVKVPNINGRASWNYVKTTNSVIVGSVPFNDLSRIREIFNKGVTFWHGDYVGDYTRNNSII